MIVTALWVFLQLQEELSVWISVLPMNLSGLVIRARRYAYPMQTVEILVALCVVRLGWENVLCVGHCGDDE